MAIIQIIDDHGLRQGCSDGGGKTQSDPGCTLMPSQQDSWPIERRV